MKDSGKKRRHSLTSDPEMRGVRVPSRRVTAFYICRGYHGDAISKKIIYN